MEKEQLIFTILGSSGGAARAFLSLLNHAFIIRYILSYRTVPFI